MTKAYVSIAAGVVAAVACVTAAAADTWTGVYGNTIDATYTDGRTAKVFVESDHTYSIKLPDGTVLKGTWADADGQSCFTLTDPAPKPGDKPTCFALKEYKVGDSFSGQDASGAFTSVIHAGR